MTIDRNDPDYIVAQHYIRSAIDELNGWDIRLNPIAHTLNALEDSLLDLQLAYGLVESLREKSDSATGNDSLSNSVAKKKECTARD